MSLIDRSAETDLIQESFRALISDYRARVVDIDRALLVGIDRALLGALWDGNTATVRNLIASDLIDTYKAKHRSLESIQTRFQEALKFNTCHEIGHLLLPSDEVQIIGVKIPSEFFQSYPVVQLVENFVLVSCTSIVKVLLANTVKEGKNTKRCLRYLRKLKSLIIKLQYIATETHNRTSKSPTPIKKEPPIGGIKVGGELHALCHAA